MRRGPHGVFHGLEGGVCRVDDQVRGSGAFKLEKSSDKQFFSFLAYPLAMHLTAVTLGNLQADWAERETQRRLLVCIADRYERRSDEKVGEYEKLRVRMQTVEGQKSRATTVGMGLILPTVFSVPLATSVHPVFALGGLVAGAGVFYCLRRHADLVELSDELDRCSTQLWCDRAQDRIEADRYRDQAARHEPQVVEALRLLTEGRQLDGMLQTVKAGSGSQLAERGGRLVVGGVVLGRRG